MGSHSIERVIPWCSVKELKEEFDRMCAADRNEFGYDPYNGSWSTIHGVEAKPEKVFTDERTAHEWGLEYTSKREAVAVPVVTLEPTKAGAAKVAKAKAKLDQFLEEKLYPLEGRKKVPVSFRFEGQTKIPTHWQVTNPAWEQEVRQQILARAKAGTSKFRKCPTCGSSLAVDHLKAVACPLCGAEFLVTPTDQKAIEARKAKIAKLQAEAEVLKVEVTKAKEESKKDAKEVKREWLIVGWAAS